ncbi:MAG TPA: cupredoxin domain-containing protein [Actinomycetota bacterium]|nr:cupredoxin domain-containing protein [Actinomycetota bacterium]
MSDETIRERAVLPLGVPLAIFAAVAAVVFLFSRILLNVPRQVAVAVALMTALNILVTCAVLALRRIQGFTALLLLAVIAVPIVLGGAAAAKVIKIKEPHAAAGAQAGAGGATQGGATQGGATQGGGGAIASGPISLSAVNIAFNKSSLDIAANTPTKVNFRNADTQPHNFHVFQGPPGFTPPPTPPIADPGSTVSYDIPPLPAGAYQFRCDLHPGSMLGKLTVH